MAQSRDWLTDTPDDPDADRAKKWLTQNPQPKPAYTGQGTYMPQPPQPQPIRGVTNIVNQALAREAAARNAPYYSGQGTYQPAPVPRPLVQQQGRNASYNYNPNTGQVVPATSNQMAYDQYYRGLYGQPAYSGQGTYQPGPGFTAVQPRTQQDFLRAEWNGYIKPRTQQDFRRADEQSWADFQKYFTNQQTAAPAGTGGSGTYDPYAGYGGYGGGGGTWDDSTRWWLNPSVWRI